MKKLVRFVYVFLFCFICHCDIACCQTSKVYKLIYKDFDVNSYDKCVRLLNGSAEIGCQSKSEGNVGAVYHINSTDRITDFLQHGQLPSYIPLVDANYFNGNLIKQLIASAKVEGIIVYEPVGFVRPTNDWSPELACPKQRFGLYNTSYGTQYECKANTKPWNPAGDGLTEMDIPFPIFHLLRQESAQEIIQCYNKYNVPEVYPLCSVQMKSHMFGAVDSPTCIRRTNYQTTLTPTAYCDPIGGWNCAASLKPLPSKTNQSVPDPTILVTAAIDSRSFMMSNTAPGDGLATGFITLLAVAKALGELSLEKKQNLNKNVMFVLFDGEAFDNIGSTRMVFDMKNSNFPLAVNKVMIQPAPIRLENIERIIELGALGHITDQLYVHFDTASEFKKEVDEIIGQINSVTQGIGVTAASSTVGLVPSSLQTFLKSRSVPGVVLADYDTQFKNKYFFSRYDELKNMNIDYNENTTDAEMKVLLHPVGQKLTNVALATAKMIYQQASTTANVSDLSIEATTVTELLFCYLHKANCDIFNEVITTNKAASLPEMPFNRYVSVFQTNSDGSPKPSAWVEISRNLLAVFTGEHLPSYNATTCKSTNAKDQTVSYFYMKGKVVNGTAENYCVRSSSFLTKALVPAFDSKKLSENVENYGLWTESRWTSTTFSLKLFLEQDELNEGMTLLAGLLVLVVSFTMVYVVDTKSGTLFQPTSVL